MVTNNRFLYCCGCHEVHRATSFDQAPIYEFQNSQVREIPMDDRRRFMERHSGHAIEELSRVAEDWLEPENAVDPMADNYLLVANERCLFLLQRSRRSIAEPVVYQVMPRRLPLWPPAFDRDAVNQWTRRLRAQWLHGKARLRRSLVGAASAISPRASQPIATDSHEKMGASRGFAQSAGGRRATQ